ncbi:GlcNac transferase [Achlya hypogyna]|uniref:GlcNac transferase n=1 Tax=Achlya hypogyna TaxID=1202772 RepID=A0A1V9Z1H6_ACHHY|nr:GlcNac transferase [Achlya hypogyna]
MVALWLALMGATAMAFDPPPPQGVTHTLSFANHNPNDPYDKEWKEPNTEITLYPETQNTPLDPALRHLQPPPPRIPSTFDIFVGLSAFRDGYRCGYTVFTGFKRSSTPDRLYFGIVDQVNPEDLNCVDEYCKLAKEEWPEEECKYRSQIKVDKRSANDSRGPTLARSQQQDLIGDQEFCLQLDAHSIFTNDWNVGLIEDWKTLNNEMGVLTTYLHNLHDFIGDDGSNNAPNHLPHICQTMRGGNGLVRNIGADLILQPKYPQMTALWGAGFSFSKCHAETRVRTDSHTLWMFDGEEFLRASHLWTHGYDLYSPSRTGCVVYHNYTSVPARFEYVQVDEAMRKVEREMGENRFKLLVDWPFKGAVDTTELHKYPWGTARSLPQYLNFSGITFEEGKRDEHSCKQLYWVPYTDPSSVEALLPGWHLRPEPTIKNAQVLRGNVEPNAPEVPGEDATSSAMGLLLLVVVGVSFVVYSRRSKHVAAKMT